MVLPNIQYQQPANTLQTINIILYSPGLGVIYKRWND